MLSIGFHGKNSHKHASSSMGEEFYLWLARSEFSKIGQSLERSIVIDEEEICLPLVELSGEIRRQFKQFIYEAVVKESDSLLTRLGDYPQKEKYQAETYRLRKLQELRKCIEDEEFLYLQRV
ncbi:MAG: hypothetical protein AB4290_11255 [Spirulina sp.]